jgi:indole-3-glycerol phosphate synthase
MTAVRETGTYLDRILARTVETVWASKSVVPPAEMAERARSAAPPIPARTSLQRGNVAVISEFKRASPSRGRFPVEIDPESVARRYIEGGAAAISCLTDEPFFHGTLNDLREVVAVASGAHPPVPVLRKDFTIDPYQIDEARANGASLVLLIVACLDDVQLRDFREHAEALGMEALVEVHADDEAERAVASGATLIGINNRNLKTFDVDLGVTERIAPHLPDGTIIVGESGIFLREHVERMANAGVHAVLVGESLIVQEDRAAAVRALSGVPRERA